MNERTLPRTHAAQQMVPSCRWLDQDVVGTPGAGPAQTVCSLSTVINDPAENILAARSLYTLMIIYLG